MDFGFCMKLEINMKMRPISDSVEYTFIVLEEIDVFEVSFFFVAKTSWQII